MGGSQDQLLEQLGFFNFPQGRSVSKNQLVGITSMSEVRKGLSTSGWRQGASISILPKPGVQEVCMCKHQQTSSWTSGQVGDPGLGQWSQAGRGSVLKCSGRGAVVLLGECASALCLQQASGWTRRQAGDPWGSQGGLEKGQGCWADRRAMLFLNRSGNMHVCS